MKHKILALVLVIGAAALLLMTFIPGIAASGRMASAESSAETLTIYLNLGSNDPVLDPAQANWNDLSSRGLVDQVFPGLVRIDDGTGKALPDLATGWTASNTGQVFTFTLRSGVTWTDGKPFTAADVRYAILRSLDPATAAPWAYPLFAIQNAAGYNDGSISDPNQVGVTVLDSLHLRFDLEAPSGYFPALLALGAARPVPAWAISSHPNDWTEPSNIVTLGPYRLYSWTHDVSLTLEKWDGYFDAANVQIEKVVYSMLDEGTAWNLYLNGSLDSAQVPSGDWRFLLRNSLLGQAMQQASQDCIYYYGFNTAKPPFDNPLVRKAFIAALDRQAAIDSAQGSAVLPALTFTPPLVWGHVDGYSAGIGIGYNPSLARQYLADAGYPGGAGLPLVTLYTNAGTGHVALANAITQQWSDQLGIFVPVATLEWGDYLALLNNNPPQVWRMGWCGDHADAASFLQDAIDYISFSLGEWNNPTYHSLVDQAVRTLDDQTRAAYYRQAEEILVENDAVVMPFYYYGQGIATQAHLQRTFPLAGYAGRIADWRLSRVAEVILPGGGDLVSYSGNVTVTIPSGTFSQTVVLSQRPAYGEPPGTSQAVVVPVFELTAVISDTGTPVQPNNPFSLQITYPSSFGPVDEDTLGIYAWNGSAWTLEPSSALDQANRRLTASPNHLSLWAVLGNVNRLYLPLAAR